MAESKPRGNDVLQAGDVISLGPSNKNRDKLSVSIEVRAEIEAIYRIVNGVNKRLEKLHEMITDE